MWLPLAPLRLAARNSSGTDTRWLPGGDCGWEEKRSIIRAGAHHNLGELSRPPDAIRS